MRIKGTNHCGEIQRTYFKQLELFQDVQCRRDYSKRGVPNFANQIQSEYYRGNISVSIDGITLENVSAVPQADINSSTLSCQRHAVFHYFLSDNSKQDAPTTTAQSKRLISLLKENNVSTTSLRKI